MKKIFYGGALLLAGFLLFLFFLPETAYKLNSQINLLSFSKSPVTNLNPSDAINESQLKKKIHQGLADWAKKQIQEDLSIFTQIKTSQLEAILQEEGIADRHLHNTIINLVLFQVRNQKVTVKLPPMPKNWTTENIKDITTIAQKQYLPILDIITYLAEKHLIPDVDFIVGINDYAKISHNNPIPVFSPAKDLNISAEKFLILMPDLMNIRSAASLRPKIRAANLTHPWANKKSKLFWRGGIYDSSGFRHKLVTLSKQMPESIDAEFVNKDASVFITPEEHLNYKYLISIDGVRCSWERLIWHMHSNSLTFKHQSNQVQWYYKGILPYVHYIPVQDEATLLTAIDWAEKHSEDVQSIIKNSTQFVEENLELEDMAHYFMVLLQEYSKKIKGI